jgi:hypothetical protein
MPCGSLQPLTGAYGGLYSRYLRCPFSLGLKSESSEKSEKSSLEEAWRCNDGGSGVSDVAAGRSPWHSQPQGGQCWDMLDRLCAPLVTPHLRALGGNGA